MAQSRNRKADDLCVLIVEDDLLIGLDVTDAVKSCGYRTIGPAASEDEAMALAEADRPDILFADINLGSGGCGISLARKMIDRFGELPVVFLTAHEPDHFADELNTIKPLAWISKPFLDSDVRAVLDKVGPAINPTG